MVPEEVKILIVDDHQGTRMVMKKMRDTSSLKDIPFLMITAEADKRHIVSAVRAGINNYILKPVTAEVMKKKLIRMLSTPLERLSENAK